MAKRSKNLKYYSIQNSFSIYRFIKLLFAWSTLGWIFMTLCCFAGSVDLSLGSGNSLNWFTDSNLLYEVVLNLSKLVFLSALMAILVTLPTVVLCFLFRHQTIIPVRQIVGVFQAKKRSVLPYLIFFLVFSHFSVMVISTLSIPQVTRGYFHAPTFVSDLSKKIHAKFLQLDKAIDSSTSQKFIFSSNKTQQENRKIFFFFPSRFMAQSAFWNRWQKNFGQETKFIIDRTHFSNQLSEILFNSPLNENLQLRTFVTLDLKKDFSRNLENSEMKNQSVMWTTAGYNSGLVRSDKERSDRTVMIARRMLMGMPHLRMLLFTGLLSSIESEWDYLNLYEDDYYLLNRFSKLFSAQPSSYSVIQLSEFEQRKDKFFHPFASVNWPSSLKEEEIEERQEQVILEMSNLFAKLVNEEHLEVWILPYSEDNENKIVTHALALNPSRLIEQKSDSVTWITSDIFNKKQTCFLLDYEKNVFKLNQNDLKDDVLKKLVEQVYWTENGMLQSNSKPSLFDKSKTQDQILCALGDLNKQAMNPLHQQFDIAFIESARLCTSAPVEKKENDKKAAAFDMLDVVFKQEKLKKLTRGEERCKVSLIKFKKESTVIEMVDLSSEEAIEFFKNNPKLQGMAYSLLLEKVGSEERKEN